jgi:hypothetical protein
MTDPFFSNLRVIKELEKAYDLCILGYTKGSEPWVTRNKKRSRSEWEQETNGEIFKEIFTIMSKEGVFSTFRSLILTSFHKLVSISEFHELYQVILDAIINIRFMITKAESLYVSGKSEDFYYYMVDDLVTMLRRVKHPILIFHLSLNVHT